MRGVFTIIYNSKRVFYYLPYSFIFLLPCLYIKGYEKYNTFLCEKTYQIRCSSIIICLMHQPSNNMAYKKFSNIIMYCYIRYLLICKSNTSLQFCWIKIVKHKKNGMPINNKTFYTFHKFRVLELEKNLGYQNNHKHVEREGNSVFLYLDCITRKCYFSVFLFYFISPSLYLYSTLMDAINLWVHFFNYVEQGRLLFLFLFTFTALDRNI